MAMFWKEVTLQYSWKVISLNTNSDTLKLAKAKFITCFAKWIEKLLQGKETNLLAYTPLNKPHIFFLLYFI